MEKCKKCESRNLVKAGFTRFGRQQYKCKSCKSVRCDGDLRQKYDENVKEMAFILYTEGNGFRRIARILSKIYKKKIYYQTVYKWLQSRHSELQIVEKTDANIEILEADELFTYIKKNEIHAEFGLLWTGIGCICVNLKSVIHQLPHG